MRSPKMPTPQRAAALLHDVGHGSFSHVMEKVLGFHHEKWTVKVVLSEDTEIGQLLAAYSPELPRDVAAIIEGKFQPAALASWFPRSSTWIAWIICCAIR